MRGPGQSEKSGPTVPLAINVHRCLMGLRPSPGEQGHHINWCIHKRPEGRPARTATRGACFSSRQPREEDTWYTAGSLAGWGCRDCKSCQGCTG